jgi:hypothetical protein
LYNDANELVDSVNYKNENPWPECSEDDNCSIELLNPFYDNSVPQSWQRSENGGTPGYPNHSYVSHMEYEDFDKFSVSQNFPNPFNGTTSIVFDIPSKSDVKIYIHDILGQLIKRIDLNSLSPGKYKKEIDLNRFPSGVYIYNVSIGKLNTSKKMIYLK